MSGFAFPIRRSGGGCKSGLKKSRQVDLALKSNETRRIKMTKFMYLFRGNATPQGSPSPEQMEQTMKKWMGWMDTLKKNGHMEKGGERLYPTGKVVRGKATAITDGPYVEVKDSIQGYLLIEAADMNQAVELSKGCPILEDDGSVEIRPIFAM
jgi:hypothetical protein